MNIQSIIVAAAVAAAVVLAIIKISRNRGSCCGSCENCEKGCRGREKKTRSP